MINRLIHFCILAGLLFGGQYAQAGAHDDILMAANKGDTATVTSLLQRGMDINTTDTQGNTLLMISVRENNDDLARFLVENRANPTLRNKYGDTALALAALKGNESIVKTILDRKIDPNHKGWSPLHYAAYGNHAKIASMLLTAGANVNAHAPNGYTALMVAAKRGHLETVKVLVAAKADVNEIDPNEGTALDMARKAGHEAIYDYLANSSQR